MRMASALRLLCVLLAFQLAALEAQEQASLKDVVDDYSANAVAADRKYLDKPLAFSNAVAAVEKDPQGRYYLKLSAGRLVRCYFSSDQLKELSTVKAGSQVALRGICKGFDRTKDSNHLLFVECKFGLYDGGGSLPPALAAVRKSLVIVDSAESTGSGFICSIGGVKFVASNFHVFYQTYGLKLLDSENRQIEYKSVRFAPDRDLALFELADQSAYEPLELQREVSLLPVEMPVRVYGNSDGKGVFTDLSGKILGVGPSSIEIDAPFVPGNSGCPVLSYPEMKVVGVATLLTYALPTWVMQGSRFASVRRFATRIDNLDPKQFEIYDKTKFEAELKTLNSQRDLLYARVATLCNLKGVGDNGPLGSPGWSEFLLYAGRLPDSSKKARLVQLVQQWNKAMGDLKTKLPGKEQSASGQSSKALMEKKSSGQSGIGLSDNSGSSLQKLPFEDLNRLLFSNELKPSFTYKRLQADADLYENLSEAAKERFKARYDNLKAILRN